MSQSGLNVPSTSKDGKSHPMVQISVVDKKVFAKDDDDIEFSPEDDVGGRSKSYIRNKQSTLSMTYSDSFRFQSVSQGKSPSLTKFQKFKLFLYNKHDDTVCGRTGAAWFKIVTYYTLFVGGNTLLFLLLIYFLDASSATAPFESKLGLYSEAAPGFTYLPSHIETSQVNLLRYSIQGGSKDTDKIIKDIDTFMSEQDKQCKLAMNKRHICKFNRTSFGPCSSSDYGYKSKKPCVFIKLNNLDRWIPKRYSKKHLPQGIPADLRNQISDEVAKVWIHCYGSHKADEEMLGVIKYHPSQSFHQQYFPTDRQDRFNPVLAIQLEQIQPGRIVQLKCKLYAPNIKDTGNAGKELYIYIT